MNLICLGCNQRRGRLISQIHKSEVVDGKKVYKLVGYVCKKCYAKETVRRRLHDDPLFLDETKKQRRGWKKSFREILNPPIVNKIPAK